LYALFTLIASPKFHDFPLVMGQSFFWLTV
jgi:hypothetical protein